MFWSELPAVVITVIFLVFRVFCKLHSTLPEVFSGLHDVRNEVHTLWLDQPVVQRLSQLFRPDLPHLQNVRVLSARRIGAPLVGWVSCQPPTPVFGHAVPLPKASSPSWPWLKSCTSERLHLFSPTLLQASPDHRINLAFSLWTEDHLYHFCSSYCITICIGIICM